MLLMEIQAGLNDRKYDAYLNLYTLQMKQLVRPLHQPGGQPGLVQAGPLALPRPACPLLQKMTRSRAKVTTGEVLSQVSHTS